MSFETWGRLWLRPMPRNVSSSVTGFDVIDEPRSAWMVSWSGGTWWRVTASAISSLASSPDSDGATHRKKRSAEQKELDRLVRRNERLEDQLTKHKQALEIQGKASELLARLLAESADTETEQQP